MDKPLLLRISQVFSFIMILAYLSAGIFVLTSSRFESMTSAMRIGFAAFLFIYAIFRVYRFYKLLKRPVPVQEKNEI